jgi:hypothetical protein
VKDFRWNLETNVSRFDPRTNEVWYVSDSYIGVVNNPHLSKIEDVLFALCHVVSELVEIEENRNV